MRNKGLVSVLIGAIIFGLLAATGVSAYLRNIRESTSPNAMVVAKVDIPVGAKVTADHLTIVNVPKAATPDGTFTSIDQIVGRVTLTKISAREPLIANRLALAGATAGLSAVIPEGYRAMSINIDDETGIANFLTPGTLVDVLAVLSADSTHSALSKIVLQKIKVLANGQNLEQPSQESDTNRMRTVTLQVTPDESEKLALAATEGKLRLALRNSVDQRDELTNGVTKQTFLGERTAPAPAIPLPRTEPSLLPVYKPTPSVSPRRQDSTAGELKRTEPSSVPPQPNPQASSVPPASIEVIEGGKRRTVVIP